ncbi:hypothetical protein HCN44_009227 [Aphidius gifuensis]|uniref:Fatty acyl-CoA reductase n=1 Tax=Aphidius gifuensis TaxID=684658 RepID=A0A835CV88_APHGI|nr:hypothetical protein HCN44_009227 [Aphidius gifuensis]
MSLVEWYGSRDILITGITSEVGRILLEKILRTLPNVTIYTIVRSSNGLLKEDRIKQIFLSPGFERLRQQESNAINRVKVFEGNLQYDDLGLSENECLKLKNIEIVFHTGGPKKELLEFCKNKLTKLQSIAIAMNLFKSKTLSENLIVRLPIVGPAYKEPLPGFLEILRGPSAMMIGAGFAFGHADLPAEIVPVDIAVNALIAAAWERGLRDKSDETAVYNIPNLGCTWKQLIEKGQLAHRKFPYPTFGISGMTSIGFLHWFFVFFIEWLPSVICDTILNTLGAKPRFIAEHEKIQQSLRALEDITSKTWNIERNNIYQLENFISPKDKDNFSICCDIDVESYVICAAASARKNCVNETNITIMKNFKRLFYALIAMILILTIFK